MPANSDWGRNDPSYGPDMLPGPSAADEATLLVYFAGLLAAAAICVWLWVLADKRATSRRLADAKLKRRQELWHSQQTPPDGLPPDSAAPEAENPGTPAEEA